MHPLLRVHFCCEFYIQWCRQWLAVAVAINENTMTIRCYQIEFCIKHSAPSSRELLSKAKLRELKRLFQIIKTPSVIFCYAKNDSPLKDGAEAQIEFDIKIGQGLPLSDTGSL